MAESRARSAASVSAAPVSEGTIPAAVGSRGSATSSRSADGPGARLRRAWRRLAPLPGGKWAFSRLVGWMAPYSGSIRARVEELAPGFCRASLRERRALRNPFRSIHAVALLNLAELASGLATLFALPDDARGIITALHVEYEKKARGVITAECRTEPPAEAPAEAVEHIAEVTLTDAAGEVVAVAHATWRIAATRTP
jgi:acyl-coenzyme A thioesterase PaaI-like protein